MVMTFFVSAPDWVVKEYEAFRAKLPELLAKYKGKYAVVKGGEVQGIFNSLEETYRHALERFGIDGRFIIQSIEEERVEYFSPTHVLGLDAAQLW